MRCILFHLRHPLFLLILLISLLFSSCTMTQDPPIPVSISYSFFVAGHTYGKAGVDNIGLHPPFQDKFDMLNDRGIELGFLTGDIVKQGTVKDWDEVDSVLNYLNATVYFAVGNHDMTDRELYESRYGNTYFDFTYKEDLFIILDPNIDQWNISGDQLDFLKDVLNSKADKAEHIFVFFHQLLWWEKDNKYKNFKPNSFEGRADTINFWSEVEPLFSGLVNQVFMFAGDFGAANWSDNFMYDHYGNISLLSSGMGEGYGDNFLIINVPDNGEVTIELIPLYGVKLPLLISPEGYTYTKYSW